MKITYRDYIGDKPNPQFKTIDRIRMVGPNVTPLVLYYGSDEELIDLTDYNEYGWEYLVKKIGTNDYFNLNQLRDKDLIGNDQTDISTVSSTFFPTLCDDLINENIYTGMRDNGFIVGGDHITIQKIEIDDKVIFTKDEDSDGFNTNNGNLLTINSIPDLEIGDKLIITYITGTNPYIYFKSGDFTSGEIKLTDTGDNKSTSETFAIMDWVPDKIGGYFGTITVGEQRLLMVKVDPNYDTVEFYEGENLIMTALFEGNDVLYSKVVWFVITSGGIESISDINLSYLSWEMNRNPHRNADEYLLSTIDKTNIDQNPHVCDNVRDDVWMDLSSGTLVGNKVIKEPILLKNIVEKYKALNTWDPCVCYSAGDIVEHYNSQWLSLSDMNQGNNPLTTNEWSLSDSIKVNQVKRGYVVIHNEEGGTVFPGTFTYPRKNRAVSFTITFNPGYILRTPSSGDTQVMYAIWKKSNGVMRYYTSSFSSSGNLDIYFVRFTSKISLLSTYKDDEPISRNFNIDKGNYDSTGKIVSMDGNTEYTISFAKPASYQLIKSMKVRHVIGSNIVATEDVDYTEDNGVIYIKDCNRYPANYEYVMELIDAYYIASVVDFTGFYIDAVEKNIVKDTITEFRLYPVDDDFTSTVNMSLSNNEGGFIDIQPNEDGMFKVEHSHSNSEIGFHLKDNYYSLTIDSHTNLNNNIQIKIWR